MLLTHSLNSLILSQASKLSYLVKDNAPSDERALFNNPSLIVWSGASDKTFFQCERVNWAFRALHDALHLETGLGFTVPEEIELGRIQASKYEGIIADIVYLEVAGQAAYHKATGSFVADQVAFTMNGLRQMGHKVA